MNYKTMKLSTLRKIVKDKKVDGYEEMERAELIEALNPKEELKEEKPKEVKKEPEKVEEEKPVEPVEPKEEAGITGGHTPAGSKAEIMKAKLALQPKVRIIIPLEGKEKSGSTESVILNGYRLNILKGAYVDVPEQVAEIIMESQHQTRIASDELKRMDGRPMKIEGETPLELN